MKSTQRQKIIPEQCKSEKYKYVYVLDYGNLYRYLAEINRKGYRCRKYFDTEREAGLYIDKKLLELGEEPVNILKRK